LELLPKRILLLSIIKEHLLKQLTFCATGFVPSGGYFRNSTDLLLFLKMASLALIIPPAVPQSTSPFWVSP
jgi:hypothetical protein